MIDRIVLQNLHKVAGYVTIAKQGSVIKLPLIPIIVSPKMPTKNYQDFCPGSLLEGRAEILVIFGWHFGRNDDLIKSF